MDYKSFLAPRAPLVLPYFGGTRVDAADRRLRLAKDIEPGWWRFEIEGRRAVPVDRAAPVDLGALPAMRGHWVDGWIVASGRELGRIALPPDDEPAPLARATARRWYSGDLVLESIDFEDDAELAAREALEQGRAIGELRGVVPSLRAAFGFALGTRVARDARVPVSPRELVPWVVEIADGGAEIVRRILDLLLDQRRAAEEAARARLNVQQVVVHQRTLHVAAAGARERVRHGTPAERADAALEQAGARMLSCRRVGGSLEVTCEIEGERIIATVDSGTLQVLDAGICLAGADREITLDSLPSVVREAIEQDHLNITRR
jgi:hypothetical protein